MGETRPPSEEDVEALRLRLAEEREKLTLMCAPVSTVSLFAISALEYLAYALRAVLTSLLTWLVAVPLTAAYFYLKFSHAPELFEAPVCGIKLAAPLWHLELALKEASWWIILGVLSSVGFGTGLHSGMMFLFPHVLQVVTAAESCHTTKGLIPWYQHPCKLDCSTTSGPFDDSTVTFWNIFLKVTVPCMLWGFGTAVGELPPYLVSKAARTSGKTDEDFAKEMEEAKTKTDVFSRMKLWTVNFTEKHGFLGIFLLASWPNAAFDMCGMCCGYLLMPFWTFFIATTLGKGVVKVNGQAAVFVNLFGSAAFEVLLKGFDRVNGLLQAGLGRDLELRALVGGLRAKLLATFQKQNRFHPDQLFQNDDDKRLNFEEICSLYGTEQEDKMKEIAGRVLLEWDKDGDQAISMTEAQLAASRTDGKVSLSSLDPGAPTSIFKVAWELFIVGLVLFFVVSIMNQMAQSKQAEFDEVKVEEARKKAQKKK